ncbi:hypothetical protein EW146_g2094 [Bondarzewia mesenterica]|uniref:Uncharacterized protein n=1 Tax=Bondarzewia mesenterica TaxID=1095465 RepID=A0A4S4M3A0_9AGAM|nr:hypothetical protein EW146_g2094 [Bondarzewia mesenterica]
MKIPSSSSMLLASLAISSSSSSLAALAHPVADAEPTTSVSTNTTSTAIPSSASAASVGSTSFTSDHQFQSRQLAAIGDLLEGLPVVGKALTPLLKALGLDSSSAAASTVALTGANVEQIKAAAQQAAKGIQDAVGAVRHLPRRRHPQACPRPQQQ